MTAPTRQRYPAYEYPELVRVAPPRRPPNRRRRGRWHMTIRVIVVLAAITTVLAATSVVGALRTPDNAEFKAKWADWLRAHHASFAVNSLEAWYYSSQAPTPGGLPGGLNAIPALASAVASTATVPARLRPPAPVPLVVSPALPNEVSPRSTWPPTSWSW